MERVSKEKMQFKQLGWRRIIQELLLLFFKEAQGGAANVYGRRNGLAMEHWTWLHHCYKVISSSVIFGQLSESRQDEIPKTLG